MNGNKREGLIQLRNRYTQAQVEAQTEGRTLPPFQQWVEQQRKQQKLASLSMQPSGVVR